MHSQKKCSQSRAREPGEKKILPISPVHYWTKKNFFPWNTFADACSIGRTASTISSFPHSRTSGNFDYVTRTMKAVVKAEAKPGLWLQDVPVPEVRGDDVQIRVLKTSICGTDVHIYNWDAWAQKTIPVPMTIGHEFVGIVDAVGDHVKGFASGDLVVGEGHITCGHCRNCLAGRRHLCPNTQGVGVNRPGAWAEFVAIPQDNCWHADPSIPLDVLSCFDPLGNAVHTAL